MISCKYHTVKRDSRRNMLGRSPQGGQRQSRDSWIRLERRPRGQSEDCPPVEPIPPHPSVGPAGRAQQYLCALQGDQETEQLALPSPSAGAAGAAGAFSVPRSDPWTNTESDLGGMGRNVPASRGGKDRNNWHCSWYLFQQSALCSAVP